MTNCSIYTVCSQSYEQLCASVEQHGKSSVSRANLEERVRTRHQTKVSGVPYPTLRDMG